ncbi:MAG: hypothetical protein JWR26_3781 [Pedosphaera sp.]|nr:hypothetical protein [Pedosphaera sp.]
MNKLTCTTALIAALCLASGATALSQDAPRPVVAPAPPNAPAAPFEHQYRVTIDPVTGLPAGAKVEIDPNTGLPLPVDPAAAQAKAQAEQEMAEEAAAAGLFSQGGGGREHMPVAVYNGFGSSVRADRSLVIRFTETDPKSIATAEEDLNIMGRILEKAISQKVEDEQRHAMGIKVVSVFGPGSARNLQIEGQGAIFMLNVNFPLAGPAGNTNESATNEPSSSTWDEAKREVYGQPSGREGDPFAGAFPREEFDPKRVENLKNSLLEALKNASNMHSLKPDETVTVVVTSEAGEPGFGVTRGMTLRSSGGNFSYGMGGGGGGAFGKTTSNVKKNRRPDAPSASVMTIRAKKSDIDLFAKGKLALDDFRKKANVSIY